jgi:hypothetical protein
MEKHRIEGNTAYKAGKLEDAAAAYRLGLQIFEALQVEGASEAGPSRPTAADVEEVVKILGNLCLCEHKLGQLESCMQHAEKILQLNPFYAKGHGFLGMALVDLYLSGAKVEPASELSDQNVIALGNLLSAQQHFRIATNLLPDIEAQFSDKPKLVREALLSSLNALAASPTATSADKSPSFPATKEVEVQPIPSRGRGVVALKNLSMHTIVGVMSAPFSVGYYDDWNTLGTDGKLASASAPPRLCVSCGLSDGVNDRAASGVPGVPICFSDCPKCHAVAYCGEICAAMYAQRHAEHECVAFQKLRAMKQALSDNDRPDVAAEVYELGSHVITTTSGILVNSPHADSILKLDSHAEVVVQTLEPVPELVYQLYPDRPQSWLNQLLGVIRCNALQLSDSTGLPVGQALYANEITYFNHSCAPNAALDPENRVVRTIRPILHGEEICISYTPVLYWPRALRQNGMKERYFFTCSCARCQVGAPSSTAPVARSSLGALASSVLEQLLVSPSATPTKADATKYYHTIVQNLAEGVRSRHVDEIDAEVQQELESTMKDLLAELHPLHYLVQDIRNAQSFVASAMGDTGKTFQLCRDEFRFWEMLIPGALPVKADKLRNMSCCVQMAKSSDLQLSADETDLKALYDIAVKR